MVNLTNQSVASTLAIHTQRGTSFSGDARSWYAEYFAESWRCSLGHDGCLDSGRATDPHCRMTQTRRVDALQADGARYRPSQKGKWTSLIPVDADNDGAEDDGYVDGIQEWGLGYGDVLQRVASDLRSQPNHRDQGGQFEVNVDHNRSFWGYCGDFSSIGGIEYENYLEVPSDMQSTLGDVFSSRFSMLRYWGENTQTRGGSADRLTYPQTKAATGTFNEVRAMATLASTGAPERTATLPAITAAESAQKRRFRARLRARVWPFPLVHDRRRLGRVADVRPVSVG